jgi:hypothetical protein
MKKVAIASLAMVAIVASLLGTVTPKALAATGGLTISPTSINQEIAPGSNYKGTVLVINQGQTDIDYRVYATPYSVSGEDYNPYFAPIAGATDISSWFSFSKTSNTLKPGAQDSIAIAITVPKGVGAGSYYGTIFAETEDKSSASGVITRKRVGTVVYIRVSGKAIEQGNITAWSVPWLQRNPLSADLKLANSGSVHFQSTVNVTVSDVFGGNKFTYQRQPMILPQKLRSIPISWTNGATFGLFKVQGNVTYLGKTQKLQTKIVFIASTAMRLACLGFIAIVVFGLIFFGKKRVAKK